MHLLQLRAMYLKDTNKSGEGKIRRTHLGEVIATIRDDDGAVTAYEVRYHQCSNTTECVMASKVERFDASKHSEEHASELGRNTGPLDWLAQGMRSLNKLPSIPQQPVKVNDLVVVTSERSWKKEQRLLIGTVVLTLERPSDKQPMPLSTLPSLSTKSPYKPPAVLRHLAPSRGSVPAKDATMQMPHQRSHHTAESTTQGPSVEAPQAAFRPRRAVATAMNQGVVSPNKREAAWVNGAGTTPQSKRKKK